MRTFGPYAAQELNTRDSFFNALNYRSIASGRAIRTMLGIEKNSERKLLVLEAIFSEGVTDTPFGKTVRPSERQHAGAGIFKQVLEDMELYARSRPEEFRGMAVTHIVNPTVALALLRRGWTVGDAPTDARLYQELSHTDFTSNQQYLAWATRLEKVPNTLTMYWYFQ